MLIQAAHKVLIGQLILMFLLKIAQPQGMLRQIGGIRQSTALRWNRDAPDAPGKAQAIVGKPPVVRRLRLKPHGLQQGHAAFPYFMQLLLGSFVHTGNGGTCGNIMELLKQKLFPKVIQPLLPVVRHFLSG